ncbi:MAG: DUF2330 domain-containing protein, partial [Myxococcales bacterium]|nr:DUF2330 domain-containing protein [Myxococcales bacterium]
MHRSPAHTTVAFALAGLAFVAPRLAEACGCFAPPTPAQPVVQAGERIVFAHEDGKVVAHIQIQYQGDAAEFAWLVPLPSVPELRLGSEEMFTQLDNATAPQFLLNQTGFCGGGGGISFGCAADEAFASRGDFPPEFQEPVAVDAGAAGPYDYAVVRADEKQPMLDWLNENRFFVPDGTAAAMDPYIRPGSYFLALRLRSGESAGSIQPVVLEYESDFPMVPIILTSVAAVPDMGVLVWVLGEHRAVPHNYQHVVINEEYIDWVNGAANYGTVVARAIDEAEGGHAFVTEYAGSTSPMRGILDDPQRFGSREYLEAASTPGQLVGRVLGLSFPWAPVQAVLQKYLPMPAEARADGVQPQDYYQRLDFYLPNYDPSAEVDIAAVVADLWERIVEPTLEAGQLFNDHPMVTRFYTTLDPEEMSKDPVFAFNPDLPEVSRVHQATMENTCEEGDAQFILHLDDGRAFNLEAPADFALRDKTGLPRARIVQVLRQEGDPEVVVDNRAAL